MKLNDGFILHNNGKENILVSTGITKFSGLIQSNSTAGFIISCLTQETTEDKIVKKMLEKWNVSYEVAKNDVKNILNQLKSIGAIDE